MSDISLKLDKELGGMDLKNKTQSTLRTASFSFAKCKDSKDRQSVVDTLKGIADLDPGTIKNIEEKLRQTYVPEIGGIGNVCMANGPEIRDEYKDTFDAKDLFDYIYAVLHSPQYPVQYKGLLESDFLQVPYPRDHDLFWRLVGLGTQLQQLHLLESYTVEKYKNETDGILQNIAEIVTE